MKITKTNYSQIIYKKKKLDDKKNNENEKNNIISHINLNKFCVYLAFCCARKKRNVNNILLDEGINRYAEKLDIFNLFNLMIYDEKIKEKLNEEIFWIEMSKKCKDNLK